MRVVVAEKPSVARDIAAVLGASGRRKGWWYDGTGVQVTWAIGHLVGLPQPYEIREEWKRWDPASLPMLPDEFPLVVRDGLHEQFEIVAKLICARATREVVCATDAGREGELIFRYIMAAARCTKPTLRLWISSLTPDAIRQGFASLKPSSAYDNLAAAARARSEADWLVGMNLSRAYSLASGDSLNVGRVKTPTLAMVVAREIAVRRFVPQPYREVETTFSTEVGEFVARYVRADFDDKGKPVFRSRLPATVGSPPDPATAAELIQLRASAGSAMIKQVDEEKSVASAPQLFDLTELQRTANRLWGWTATRTLGAAQELYEKHKALSYPRTDSRHLSTSVAETLGPIVQNVRGPYEHLLVAETGRAKLLRRFVDDSKVSDHHAIIPTATPVALAPDSDTALLYDLVVRRFLAAWQPEAVEASTLIHVVVEAEGVEDRYHAGGKAVLRPGWRAIDLPGQPSDKEPKLPGGLLRGMKASVRECRVLSKHTQPPKYFTEAELLTGMERAGASLEGELSEAMKERGIGTPATRAQTIEDLVTKEYITRGAGKSIRATELGEKLIRLVHAHVASPAMTGDWEAKLRRIERGELSAEVLLADVRRFVAQTTGEALANGVAPRKPFPRTTNTGGAPARGAKSKARRASN